MQIPHTLFMIDPVMQIQKKHDDRHDHQTKLPRTFHRNQKTRADHHKMQKRIHPEPSHMLTHQIAADEHSTRPDKLNGLHPDMDIGRDHHKTADQQHIQHTYI